FSVRGIRAHPAGRRAEQIGDRIRALAANPKIAPHSLTLEEHREATWILAGDERIMALLDEDAAIEGISRDPLATLYRSRIEHAIADYRRNRQPALLWSNAAFGLGATILLLVTALFGRRFVVALRASIERRYRPRIEGLEGRARHIVRVDQIWALVTGLLNL